ncbi:MAG: hypothetical protein HY717_02305 [Planctomycetes bacterium]|nr:hypothetical protein [Planctomycetota bacterium]
MVSAAGWGAIVALGVVAFCSGPGKANEMSGGSPGLAPGNDLEEIETRDGQLYRGEVVGYDAALKGYILRQRDGEITMPEEKIIAIRPAQGPPRLEAPPAAKETGVSSASSVSREPLPQVAAAPEGAAEEIWRRFLEELEPLSRLSKAEEARNLEEARGLLIAGKSAAAKQRLERLLEHDPASPGPLLMLGGMGWKERAYPRAFRLLSSVLNAPLEAPAAEEMLAKAASELGYWQAASRLLERQARRRFDGAEELYQVFLLRRERDPGRAGQAWNEYLASDPELSAVRSPEGEFYHQGKRALEQGSFSAAVNHFAAALKANPFLQDLVQPLRLRALEGRAAQSRQEGDLDQLAADAEALAEENPPRREEYRQLREQGEAEIKVKNFKAALPPEAAVKVPVESASTRRSSSPESAAAPAPSGETGAAAPAPSGAASAAAAVASQGHEITGAAGYFPLQAGNWWAYRHGDGTRDVHRLEKIDGPAGQRTVYRFGNEIEFGETKVPYSKSGFFEEGILFLGAAADPAQADRVLALPLQAGHEWSWERGEIIYEREYLSTGATVQCRAGTFTRCLKVRASSRYHSGAKDAPAVQQLFYYAPGVGLVKIEAENPLDGRELEAYETAKK